MTTSFFFSVTAFHDIPFHMSTIDDAYSAISARIYAIHTRNKTLIIWLPQKLYCKLLSALVCQLKAMM